MGALTSIDPLPIGSKRIVRALSEILAAGVLATFVLVTSFLPPFHTSALKIVPNQLKHRRSYNNRPSTQVQRPCARPSEHRRPLLLLHLSIMHQHRYRPTSVGPLLQGQKSLGFFSARRMLTGHIGYALIVRHESSVWKSYEKEEDVHGLRRFERPKTCNATRVRTLR